MAAVVAVVGIPSAWKNPTAAALVLAWVFSQALYYFTGNGLAIKFYTFPDIVILAVIFAKPEYCNQGMYRSTLHQLWCVVAERSPSDRMVMLIFPIIWWAYVADISAYACWWILWGATVLQFLFASTESIEKFNRRAEAASDTSEPSDDVYRRLAWSRGYG